MGVRKTHEEFVNDFRVKNTHAEQIEFLSEYQTARKKILCRCKKCNYEWESLTNSSCVFLTPIFLTSFL